MAESVKPADGPTLIGNGLTSDVLRASVIEYYNNCHQHVSLSSSVHKSGSITHLNGLVNGTKLDMKSEQNLYSHGHSTPASRPPPPRVRSERPHRTHSERGSKLHVIHNLNRAIERHKVLIPNKGLYRSNSSLDLEHSGEILEDRTGVLRRDYGSASSLDVISTTGESFFAMLREFRSDNYDQRSPGPAKIREYLRGKVDPPPSTQNAANALTQGLDSFEDSQSPKIKTKFQKLWEMKDKGKVKAKVLVSEPSIFRKLRGSKTEHNADAGNKGSYSSLDIEMRLEEKLRKKAFAHYDCQSVLANLTCASRLRSLLSKRRNTTTGASAASMLNKTPTSSTENLNPEETDPGDGRSNDLLLSCPFFRNELGGEEERMISLNRMTCKKQKVVEDAFGIPPMLHKPNMAYCLSILEKTSGSRWHQRFCPYQRQAMCMEKVDCGAMCYRQFFHSQEHQNWFGSDDSLGPVAISIKREKIEHPAKNGHANNNAAAAAAAASVQYHYQYRLIIRTSELSVMRGTVQEEAVPSLTRSNQRHCHAKEVIDYVAPELQLSSLRLALPGPQTEDQLMKLDEQALTKTYKVGIMYCKAGQSTEEEMYNNEYAGPAFEEFLDLLGQRVRLKAFEKYRGGLDTKTDTTGLFSVFTTHQNCEVMFHVSTLLPYTPNNKQQLLRKRHIGNDIVTIVFQEPDALPFTPKNIRSHFQHVFIVVRAVNPCTDKTHYRVAISRSKEVSVFGPSIPDSSTFPKSKSFVDFLLAKVINAENAAHRSDKFVMMAQRTRQEYLKDLVANYCSNTTIDSGPKFSAILSFAGRRKEKTRPRFIPDRFISGAISWQVQVEDFGQSVVVDCLLAISVDTVAIIEEPSQEIVFACPCASILGWSSQTTNMKIFYHQGECVVLHAKDPDVDEIQEIVSRLMVVTEGCETQELILRRNSLGQLGFHVQFEGVVTEVENFGFAWQAGLRQGSRLVEICKVAVATLSYDQMVDLLKTSMTVSVTVIPPFPNGSARKGCNLHNCSYLSGGSFGDYENISVCEHAESHHKNAVPRQQSAFHSQRMSTRRDIHSSIQHNNRSPSIDRINTKVENKSIRHDRSDRIQHPSSMAIRDMPESLAAVFPPHLNSYSVSSNQSVNNSKQSTPSKPSVYPVPRVSPVSSNSTHSHGSPQPGSVQNHLHRSFHDHNRNSMNQQRLAHVGNMVAARSELSLSELPPYHSRPHSHHISAHPVVSKVPNEGSVGKRQGKSCIVPSNSPSSTNCGNSHMSKQSPSSMHSDYHSDSSSDWLQGTGSADELSGNNRLSPPSKLSENAKSNPSLSSRKYNDISSKLNRLRPGVTNSNRPLKTNINATTQLASSGSSCSGSTSTLQEDLLKLINPEFLDSDSNSDDHHLEAPYTTVNTRIQLSTPSSRDHSSGNTPDPGLDVILTKAQPAHVISSEPSSPAATDNRLERLSPRATGDRSSNKMKPLPPPPPSQSPLIPLPDSQEIDWSSLVTTATKAIESMPTSSTSWLESPAYEQNVENNTGTREKKLHDMEVKLQRMHQDLIKEQHQKADLAQEVLQLREENHRLHEESHTAAVQIRRYRDYLLQNREN